MNLTQTLGLTSFSPKHTWPSCHHVGRPAGPSRKPKSNRVNRLENEARERSLSPKLTPQQTLASHELLLSSKRKGDADALRAGRQEPGTHAMKPGALETPGGLGDPPLCPENCPESP